MAKSTKSTATQVIINRTNEATEGLVSIRIDSDGDTMITRKIGSSTVVEFEIADKNIGEEKSDEEIVRLEKSNKKATSTKQTSSQPTGLLKLSAKVIETAIETAGMTIETLTPTVRQAIKEKLTTLGYDMKYYSNQLANIKIANSNKK